MAAAGLRHRPHGGELVNDRVVYLCGARRTPTGRDLTTSDQDAPIEQRGGGMMNPGHGHRAVARAEGAGCRVDPATGTFSSSHGTMAVTRVHHTATSLLDGRVLIAGGQVSSGGGTTSSAEIYNPVVDQFSPVGSMTQSRGGHRATLLPDGRVLI